MHVSACVLHVKCVFIRGKNNTQETKKKGKDRMTVWEERDRKKKGTINQI